jgi:vacuolar-type H+-ATPase subunit D/Vma8
VEASFSAEAELAELREILASYKRASSGLQVMMEAFARALVQAAAAMPKPDAETQTMARLAQAFIDKDVDDIYGILGPALATSEADLAQMNRDREEVKKRR